MKKKGISFIVFAFVCLCAGAACHGLRTSGDEKLFVIGVAIGVTMIVLALAFGITGLVLVIKGKKNR